jgi:hypothetical protein
VTPPRQKGLWPFLLSLPRQVIYLVLALAVVLPLFTPFQIRPLPTAPVVSLFNAVDSVTSDKALVVSVDYSPDTEAELTPMTIAILRHAFARRLRVGVLTNLIQGQGLADSAVRQVTAEFNARAQRPEDSLRYGVDCVYWGFQTPYVMVMTGMGKDISRVFPRDFYGHPIDSLPISTGLRSYNNVGLLVSVASSALPQTWLTLAQTQYGVRIGTGVTAVSAADMYPYYSKTRQFAGLLPGMKGAAEYEELLEDRYPVTMKGMPALNRMVNTRQGRGRLLSVNARDSTAVIDLRDGEATIPLRQILTRLSRTGTKKMSPQTTAHLAIMLFIVISNIAYFATRRRKS